MFQWSGYCTEKNVQALPVLKGKVVHRYAKLGTTMQVNPMDAGHYPSEQFPALLRLLRVLPDDIPILTALSGCALCERYVNELLRIGALKNRSRLVSWEGHGHTYYAGVVYHHRPFPWEDGRNVGRGAVLRGSADLDLVRTTMLGAFLYPWVVLPALLSEIL